MATPVLPLSPDIVQVNVFAGPELPPSPEFNQPCVVGTSTVIPSVTGINPRIREYTDPSQMLTDGFQVTDHEYLGVVRIFAQTPPPPKAWVGRQDLTSLAEIAINNGSEASGHNYVVGDIVTIVQVGASLGKAKVLTVDNTGAVTGITILSGNQGTGYAIANALATTGGTGTGLLINVIAIGETPLQAITACRSANTDFYLFTFADTIADSDWLTLAAFAQSAVPQCNLIYITENVVELNGGSTTLMGQMQTQKYSRAFGIYSTTQNGLAPNNAYAACAVMGVAMGRNTGADGSYFVLMFKQLIGITPEPINETQIANIKANNGNIYVTRSKKFTWLENGVMANGQFFDEVLNLDMIASDCQINIADAFATHNVIPQNDSGQTILLNATNQAGAKSRNIGFLSPGVWNGDPISTLLSAGDPLPNGYKSISASFTTQSSSDKQARKSMPIFLPVNESGASQSAVINITVQR